MNREEQFKTIMEGALKEGLTIDTINGVIKQLQFMVYLSNVDLMKSPDADMVKNTIERYNEKILNTEVNENETRGLAKSLAKNLFR